MMREFVVFILVLLALFLEGSVTTIPLVFLCLLVLYIIHRRAWVIAATFFLGFFLDFFLVRSVGQTSVVLLLLLSLVFLYERKFEIVTPAFTFITACLGSFLYSIIFHTSSGFPVSIFSGLVAVCLLMIFKKFEKTEEKKLSYA